MKHLLTAIAAAAVFAATPASAQEVRGFAFAGSISQSSQHPVFGGGVTVDLGQPWLAAGAQGEAFVAWPYFSGQGVVFGEVHPFGKSPVRPILLGGVGFGEQTLPMIGGGIELPTGYGRTAFRLTLEDYVQRSHTYTISDTLRLHSPTQHQLAFRVGVSF